MSAHRDRNRDRDRQRPRGRCRDESGNILILFAILLPLFLFTGMVVIDVGYWWANARKAQIAADACALAAAKELPQPWTPARTECVHGTPARDYVLTNLPDQSGTDVEPLHVSTTVLSPFEGNASQVEATVEMRVQTFFGRFIGLGGVELTRRAVAEQAVGEGNYAIYAHKAGCQDHGTGNSLLFGGNHHGINGRVHANGEYRINNNDSAPPVEPFWAKEGTISDPPNCLEINTSPPDGAKFGGDSFSTATASAPSRVPPQVWPAWWTPSDFGWFDDLTAADGCDVKGKAIQIKPSGSGTVIEVDTPLGPQPQLSFTGTTLPPYVYCAWEKFTINRDDLVATMSALAPEITVDGNDQKLTAHRGNSFGKVLFFIVPNITPLLDGSLATGGNPVCLPIPAKEMVLNGNRHQWTGTIFNPCGRIKVNVGGASAGTSNLTGTILGLEVEVNGQDFVMTGKSNFGGTVILALDQ